MCSVDLDDMPLLDSSNTHLLPLSDNCRKCGSEGATIILRTKDYYCNSCFLVYFIHKFRSTIGKSRQIKPGDKVLIPFFDDHNSATMLHLLRQGLDEDSNTRLRFEPSFLFIDDSIISRCNSSAICNKISQQKFPCYYVRLEDVMKKDHINPVEYNQELPLNEGSQNKDQFLSLLSSIKCQSAKDDYIDHLFLKLICICASSLGFSKVFLPDNSTNISIRILSHIALGRGAQLPEHVGFKSVQGDISLYRPMRELMQDEVEHYVRVKDIGAELTERKISSNGIQSCTASFISGLQKEFKSTVPTVFKIGDKLESIAAVNGTSGSRRSSVTSVDEELCAICGFKIDTDRGSTSAYYSQVVSEEMSLKQPPKAGESGVVEISDNEVTAKLMIGKHCYGCRHIVKNLPTFDLLPEDTRQSMEKLSLQERMKKDIENFIL